MGKYRGMTPEQVMRQVTIEIIKRAIRLGKKKRRSIYISKTSGGKGIDVCHLNPEDDAGRRNLEDFFRVTRRQYTIHGLGRPEDRNSINWRKLNLPMWRRMLLQFQIIVSLALKNSSFKIAWYRWMGIHIGNNAEVMQLAWLDHFRPELIFIGDQTLIGAYSRLTVHSYEGGGRFRYGIVEIGPHCVIGAGTSMGMIRIENHVRTLPGTMLSPYLSKVRSWTVVGWSPPDKVGREDAKEMENLSKFKE
jgi:hypothetical protein